MSSLSKLESLTESQSKPLIYALIPIKYESVRVPNKNFRLVNNTKPLFSYIIDTLLQTDYINKIYIIIDNPKTELIITSYYTKNQNKLKNIIFYRRPNNLEGHHISTNELFIDLIQNLNLQADYYFQTHTTNPLLKKETIQNAIKYFLENNTNLYDSLFSVKELKTRLYTQKTEALNHNINELIPTQDLDPLYEENSCMYVFTRETIEKKRHRIGNNPYMFKMNDIESQDIDTESDFKIAELLILERTKKINKNQNKPVVLITGVLGGIGYSTANLFLENNYEVVGIDINNENKNNNLISKIDLLIYDIKKEENIIKIRDYVEEKYGRLNCIVNNAAYQICKSFYNSTNEDWSNVMDVNVRAPFLLSKYLKPLLKDSQGSIINISSVHAVTTSANIGLYASSKGALATLTRAMAIEYAEDNIRVNSILPGAVNTEMLRRGLSRDIFKNDNQNQKENKNQEIIETRLENLGKKHCIGRVGEPNEISEVILFLADNNKSSYIIGQSIIVDGGATIRLSTE